MLLNFFARADSEYAIIDGCKTVGDSAFSDVKNLVYEGRYVPDELQERFPGSWHIGGGEL